MEDLNDYFELLLGTNRLALGTHYIPFWLNYSLPEIFAKLIQTSFSVQIIGTTSHTLVWVADSLIKSLCRGFAGKEGGRKQDVRVYKDLHLLTLGSELFYQCVGFFFGTETEALGFSRHSLLK